MRLIILFLNGNEQKLICFFNQEMAQSQSSGDVCGITWRTQAALEFKHQVEVTLKFDNHQLDTHFMQITWLKLV